MPNIKSAKKRVRVAAAKNLRNKSYRSSLRTAIKKAEFALGSGAENQTEVVRYAMKQIDSAVSKGVLHKNTAARKKSQLARKLGSAQA